MVLRQSQFAGYSIVYPIRVCWISAGYGLLRSNYELDHNANNENALQVGGCSSMASHLTQSTCSCHFRFVQRNDNKLLRAKFGDGIPDVAETAKKISLILVNQHYSLTGPRPLTTQVIEVGGIHIKEQKPLPAVSDD